MVDKKDAFDISEYKCSEFLTGLNKCTTEDEVISYVDNIVNNLSNEDVPSVLGVTDKILGTGDKYLNSGRFDGQIKLNDKITKIPNSKGIPKEII